MEGRGALLRMCGAVDVCGSSVLQGHLIRRPRRQPDEFTSPGTQELSGILYMHLIVRAACCLGRSFLDHAIQTIEKGQEGDRPQCTVELGLRLLPQGQRRIQGCQSFLGDMDQAFAPVRP